MKSMVSMTYEPPARVLMVHATESEANNACQVSTGLVHTSIGAALTGNPYEHVLYTHEAAARLVRCERAREWVANTVCSRLVPRKETK